MKKPDNDNDNKSNIESLFFGDKRLDSMYNALSKEIRERAEGQHIPCVAIIGVLELLKDDFIKMTED